MTLQTLLDTWYAAVGSLAGLQMLFGETCNQPLLGDTDITEHDLAASSESDCLQPKRVRPYLAAWLQIASGVKLLQQRPHKLCA